MNNSSELLIEAMRNAGLDPDEVPIADAVLHRIHDKQDKPGKKDLWYVLYPDGVPAGSFGHWSRLPDGQNWQSKADSSLTSQEISQLKERREQAKASRELELQEVRKVCIAKAEKMLTAAHDVKADHPYLIMKNIKPYVARQLNGMLLIPVHKRKTLTGLQIIMPDGAKKFMTGTEKSGGYLVIRGKGKSVYLVEGWATGCTIHEQTGATVIICFDCGNLETVALEIRAKGPDCDMIMVADNDRLTDGNPGLTKAKAAALATGARLAIPEFSGDEGTDANDLAMISGAAAVMSCLEAASMVSPSLVQKNPSKIRIENPESDAWPEPISFGEIHTPDINCSLLPGWLGEYSAAVAATTQTPPGMSVMMALAVVAACVQKRFQVSRTPEHVEPLALWTATGLPPASRKTAVVNAFTGPLTAWEKERSETEKRERGRIAGIREATEAKIKALQAQAGKADNVIDRNNLIEQACQLDEEMPDPLTPPRIFTSDVTPERLQALMMEQGERMALLSDEGGVFSVMAGLYNGGKANIDIFLKGHAGSAVRVDRQSRTAHLDEPALTFGLCIQPDIIQRLSETSFRGNGCLARFLFCLPVSNIGTRTAHSIPMLESVKAAYQEGINTLLNVSPVQNEFGKEQARTITLDHGAAQAWEAFFNFMESKMGEGRELESIQDWAGKLAGAALRIAGIMAIVEQGEAAKIVTEATMVKALDLCELLITHAQAAFDLMDGDDSHHDAKHIFKWLLDKRALTFKQADVYRELRRFNDADRLTRALKALIARHIISEPMKNRTLGRPSITYDVNPLIF